MKTTRSVVALMLALAGLLVAESAFAWHHHHRSRVSIGFHFGVPLAAFPYFPYYYPRHHYYPYYPAHYHPYTPAHYPAPVVVQQQPTVYIEQPAPQVRPQQPAGYWYYCGDSRAYYPYVKECPAGWQRVAPSPG